MNYGSSLLKFAYAFSRFLGTITNKYKHKNRIANATITLMTIINHKGTGFLVATNTKVPSSLVRNEIFCTSVVIVIFSTEVLSCAVTSL